MTKQKTLFRKDVYERMARRESHNGVERALRMINQDSSLHDSLREYANNNCIRAEGSFGLYGQGNVMNGTFRDLALEFWRHKSRGSNLYLGLNPNDEIMPIFLDMYSSGESWTIFQVKEKDSGFYLCCSPLSRKGSDYEDVGVYRWDGTRITDTSLFKDVTEKDILSGLEKAIKRY